MKTALIVYGHMRTYEQCISYLQKNIIDRFDCDVFIHTWDEIEAKTKSWHNDHMPVYYLSDSEIDNIKSLFRVTDIKIENQNVPKKDFTGYNKISIPGQKFMVYSLYQANLLKRNYESLHNFVYDCVIKIRPDIVCYSSFNFSFSCLSDFVYIAGNRYKTNCIHGNLNCVCQNRACDILNITSSQNMDKICNIYHEFDRYYINIPEKQNACVHSSFIDYIKDQNISIKMIDNYQYGKQWSIIRKR